MMPSSRCGSRAGVRSSAGPGKFEIESDDGGFASSAGVKDRGEERRFGGRQSGGNASEVVENEKGGNGRAAGARSLWIVDTSSP